MMTRSHSSPSLRTTILPTEKDLADMLDRFEKFHLQFVKDHSS